MMVRFYNQVKNPRRNKAMNTDCWNVNLNSNRLFLHWKVLNIWSNALSTSEKTTKHWYTQWSLTLIWHDMLSHWITTGFNITDTRTLQTSTTVSYHITTPLSLIFITFILGQNGDFCCFSKQRLIKDG